jgi:phosphopantetheinyl transferase
MTNQLELGCQAAPRRWANGPLAYIRRVMASAQPSLSAPENKADEPWTPGPARPRLAEGAVHVWRADTADVSSRLAGTDGVAALLSANELARSERISGERRMRWQAAHALLRILLARYLDCDPPELRFARGEHGKPSLRPFTRARADGPAPKGDGVALWSGVTLYFNLSHSARAVLCAFSADGSVGVDVEVAGRDRDYAALARRMFGRVEAERLQQLDRPSRELEFLRLWTRREAELKCCGSGFRGASPVGAALGTERSARTTWHPMWIAGLDVGLGAAAAVASAFTPASVELCDW